MTISLIQYILRLTFYGDAITISLIHYTEADFLWKYYDNLPNSVN